MFFTKDILESLIMIGVITAGVVWYGMVLARREARAQVDSKKAA
jgi:hypothetical protein